MTKKSRQKFEYFENENIFHHYWRAIIKENIFFFERCESDFKFIFHSVHNPRVLYVLHQITTSRHKKIITQFFESNNMNLGLRLLFT